MVILVKKKKDWQEKMFLLPVAKSVLGFHCVAWSGKIAAEMSQLAVGSMKYFPCSKFDRSGPADLYAWPCHT